MSLSELHAVDFVNHTCSFSSRVCHSLASCKGFVRPWALPGACSVCIHAGWIVQRCHVTSSIPMQYKLTSAHENICYTRRCSTHTVTESWISNQQRLCPQECHCSAMPLQWLLVMAHCNIENKIRVETGLWEIEWPHGCHRQLGRFSLPGTSWEERKVETG